MKKRQSGFFENVHWQNRLENIKKNITEKIISDDDWLNDIESIKGNEDKLFERFLDAVKEKDYCTIGYILNYCFDDAKSISEFCNRQDNKGNTAYHYAAIQDCPEVIVLLNDQSKINGKKKKIKFDIENKNNMRPLDICCQYGHENAFNALWMSAKITKKDTKVAYQYALQGKNPKILSALGNHKNNKRNSFPGKK